MRTFIGFGQKAFIGTPGTLPAKLGGVGGTIIPLLFQWLAYGASTTTPNVNVLVDMDNADCRALDQIRSIYIDNLGSSVPVYVYFPDTNYTITAKPNSEGWYPAFTNSRKIWVIGEGFLTGSIPTTSIILSNFSQIPSVNSEIDQAVELRLASPLITRGTGIYNTNYGVPALGDQEFTLFSSNEPDGTTHPLWGTPYPSGFLYLTGFQANVQCIDSSGVSGGRFVIESTGVAGILYDINYTFYPVIQNFSPVNRNGMNLKLDATQSWRMRIIIGGANIINGIFLSSEFTTNPN